MLYKNIVVKNKYSLNNCCNFSINLIYFQTIVNRHYQIFLPDTQEIVVDISSLLHMSYLEIIKGNPERNRE